MCTYIPCAFMFCVHICTVYTCTVCIYVLCACTVVIESNNTKTRRVLSSALVCSYMYLYVLCAYMNKVLYITQAFIHDEHALRQSVIQPNIPDEPPAHRVLQLNMHSHTFEHTSMHTHTHTHLCTQVYTHNKNVYAHINVKRQRGCLP